jgi:glycosyltransferase involved in cell wall biosynthesis
VSRELPAFDLVVATVGRTDELARLLASIDAQEYERLRVIVVDQNDDDRLTKTLDGHSVDLVHLRAARGLSHARNVGLDAIDADLVAFPDDDCVYPPELLDRVARRFAQDPALDGLAGRVEDTDGAFSPSWKTDRAVLTAENLWNRANAATIFLRRDLVGRVGAFDERLGLGSGEPWSSGEETDYLIRAVKTGARIEYDPALVVQHEMRHDDARIGLRDGASVGYLLRKHGYRARMVARMLMRPIGGALVALGRRDWPRARYYAATLRGRIRGYAGASRSKSSA